MSTRWVSIAFSFGSTDPEEPLLGFRSTTGRGGGGGATGLTIFFTAVMSCIFSLVPIEARTDRQNPPNQQGSFHPGIVVGNFVPQCRTGTDIHRNVFGASES